MRNAETIGIIPIHINSGPTSDRLAMAYAQTRECLSKIVNQVITVNDGSDREFIPDAQINLEQNHGKAEAVRRAMQLAMNQSGPTPKFILQTDGDMDQDPRDVSIINSFFEERGISPDIPTLVIGNRYHQNQAEGSPHRKGLLALQNALCTALGYPEVRDPVSGLRGYTRDYVRKFLDLSGSERYGIEIESIVIARLLNAKVHEIPLTYSRYRDSYTLSSKFLDSLYAILLHQTDLKRSGFDQVVTFAEQMKNFLEEGTNTFSLNLKDVGSSGTLQFNRDGEKYSISPIQTLA